MDIPEERDFFDSSKPTNSQLSIMNTSPFVSGIYNVSSRIHPVRGVKKFKSVESDMNDLNLSGGNSPIDYYKTNQLGSKAKRKGSTEVTGL